MLFIGLSSLILNIATAYFVFLKSSRRKKITNSQEYFELYVEHWNFFCFFLMFAFLFSILILVFAIERNKDFTEGGATALFVFSFLADFFTVNTCHKCIKYSKKEFQIYKNILLSPKSVLLSDIEKVFFSLNKIVAIKQNKTLFKISNTAKNIYWLNKLIDYYNIPKLFPSGRDNKNKKSKQILIKMCFKDLILILILFLGLFTGSVFMTILGDDKKWLGFVLAVIFGLCAVLFVLTFFRYKIVVKNENITYTPIFGKKVSYSIIYIKSIYIESYEIRYSKIRQVVVNFTCNKRRIIIPLRYNGVQEFLEYFKYIREADRDY